MRSQHQPGEIIADKYKIVSILGEGNSGITYQATSLNNQQQIALKVMSLQNMTNWKLIELFDREAEILAKLDHPQIPTYLDYFQIDTTNNRAFYLAQELAEGKSLASLVEHGWHQSEAEIKEIAIALLKILVYLHLQKPAVIHRDIKPQNIIRRDDGKIFLVDFGAVGHTYHNTMMQGSTVVGTYGYMAPEQFRGQAFTATDLYGLGATLLYLLTHRSPADLPTDRLRIDFRRHVQVSEEFGDWLEKILDPDMSERFTSAAAALAALEPPKISLAKSISWKTIVLTMGISIGIFMAIKSLRDYKYAVFNQLGLMSHVHAAIYQNAINIPDYLAQGGDINGTDQQGKTLLHHAVAENKLDLIKFLIAEGANINQVNRHGNTAFYQAVEAQHLELISLLREHHAVLNNQDLKELGFALHKHICDAKKVSFFISYGVDINARDRSGSTPLHRIASTTCEQHRGNYYAKIAIKTAKILIERDADVNVRNATGQTPLHLIKTHYGREHQQLAQILLNAGANVNIQDDSGQTPLHRYVAKKGTYYNLIKMLIKAGANVNTQDNQGKTALHLAGENDQSSISRVEGLLDQSGANIHLLDHYGNRAAYAIKKEKWQQENEQYKQERELKLEREKKKQEERIRAWRRKFEKERRAAKRKYKNKNYSHSN